MLVVVAGRHDATARAFAERHAAVGAALLTPDDLSRPGWRFALGADGPRPDGTAVVAGRIVENGAIRGVLTRLPRVDETELPEIVPEDRAYVAAEMTAFLLAWLAALPCPVLNRPTPTCLGGPNWWTERWVHLAHRLGIPARPVRHLADPESPADDAGVVPPDADGADRGAVSATPAATDPSPVTVTVVGRRCFGTTDRRLATAARRLATAARADLLAVRFDGSDDPRLLTATPWPDLAEPAVAEAIVAHLTGIDR